VFCAVVVSLIVCLLAGYLPYSLAIQRHLNEWESVVLVASARFVVNWTCYGYVLRIAPEKDYDLCLISLAAVTSAIDLVASTIQLSRVRSSPRMLILNFGYYLLYQLSELSNLPTGKHSSIRGVGVVQIRGVGTQFVSR
jgi:hypothetical protein